MHSLVWRRVAYCWLLAIAGVSAGAQERVLDHVRVQSESAIALAQDIWEFAELGYLENRSTRRLQEFLDKRGFRIQTNLADIPTAFVATAGSGKPVIAILAEFDALPGLSQSATPARNPLVDGAPGHACGHHLFGAASASAGAAVASWLKATGRQGTVRVYGTPAEEGGSGKVYLTRAGVFDDVDVVLHWHPASRNDASPSSSTANKSARFTFHGIAAHAAAAPDRGRSALDGVEAMNFMVNLMREHVPSDSRIHYVITDGGAAPNIVPETAQVYYYVRHPSADMALELFERVVSAARAAALGTGTEMDYEVMHGNYPLLPNETLARKVHANLVSLGGIDYTDAEEQFAQTIRATLLGALPPLKSAGQVQPFELRQNMGSTDVGDVSWNVPTVGFSTATWVPGTSAHSWQAVAAGGMSIGQKGMLLAAKLLATTASNLYQDPQLIRAAKQELRQRQGEDFEYSALLGDRDPPLDYRL
ncbi:MAG: amidohydrolase [Gammaproteobacteria bacterium]|nr:amidohydrolase [Gammaproteobacteria bacterium]